MCIVGSQSVCLSQDWSEDFAAPPLDLQSGLATEVSALALLCAARFRDLACARDKAKVEPPLPFEDFTNSRLSVCFAQPDIGSNCKVPKVVLSDLTCNVRKVVASDLTCNVHVDIRMRI